MMSRHLDFLWNDWARAELMPLSLHPVMRTCFVFEGHLGKEVELKYIVFTGFG